FGGLKDEDGGLRRICDDCHGESRERSENT
ncbi:hypothetical protein A2U01_0107796, partial [Trifolium medium]|nr:hypothetical protein [Trifolium medium]